DRYWELTVDLARVLDRTLSDIEAALAGGSGSQSDLRCAWATALAITWLRVYAPAAEEEWRLLSLEARKWLDDVNAVPSGGWTWLDAARRFLAARGSRGGRMLPN